MRPLLTSTFVAAFAMATLHAIPQKADAKTPVLRCQMVDGTFAYTSHACSSIGAKSVPLSAATLGRIAQEQRREQELTAIQSGANASSITEQENRMARARQIPVRRPLASGCATTPEQLATDLQGAVALGDVNRIAESFDWAGMSHDDAQRIMARLVQLSKRPIQTTDYFDASVGAGLFADAGASSALASRSATAGMLQVMFDAGNGGSIVDFDVRRDKGCYLLRY